MTIAVTGATGHLGRLVIDSLLSKVPASQIVAIARDAAKAQPIAEKGVEVRVAAYDDPAALEQALSGVEKVLLISGNEVGQRYPQHKNVIDAAIRAGVSRLLYTSVPAADTSSLPVAPDHLKTEQYLASTDLDHVLLRNGWYNENYLPTLEPAAQTGTILTSAGDGKVSSASRADYAEAAAVALTTDQPLKQVYELGGDVAWTQDEFAATISSIIGKPVTVSQVTPEDQTTALTGAGLDAGTIEFLVSTDAGIRNGELEVTSGDLAALIGRATTPLADSLRAGV